MEVNGAFASTFLRGGVDLRWKVNDAFASTFLRGGVDLRWKVNGAFATMFLRGGVDLQVQELQTYWWTRERRHRNRLVGLVMEHPEAAAEVKASLGEVFSR